MLVPRTGFTPKQGAMGSGPQRVVGFAPLEQVAVSLGFLRRVTTNFSSVVALSRLRTLVPPWLTFLFLPASFTICHYF